MLLKVHFYAIETYLFEISLDEGTNSALYGSYPTTRLSLLFACLSSTKHFFDAFFELPPSVYLDMPYSTWTLLSHLNVILSRLSLCVVPGWDHSYVAATLSLDSILDGLSAKVDEAIQIAAQTRTSDGDDAIPITVLPRSAPLVFMTVGSKVKEIKAVQEARKAEISRRYHSQVAGVTPASASLESADGIPPLPDDFTTMDSIGFFDFVDEPFWTENWT